MAIILEVEDYCHNCPSFEAKVTKFVSEDLNNDRHVQTIVTCDHYRACDRVARLSAKNAEK